MPAGNRPYQNRPRPAPLRRYPNFHDHLVCSSVRGKDGNQLFDISFDTGDMIRGVWFFVAYPVRYIDDFLSYMRRTLRYDNSWSSGDPEDSTMMQDIRRHITNLYSGHSLRQFDATVRDLVRDRGVPSGNLEELIKRSRF